METFEKRELLDMIQGFNTIDFITPETVPDIDLYMDQITTFMDTHLASCKRYPDDKILTKTMINNYTKNDLIPPPVRKKYSKEHVLLLIFVYYMKDFLSISDIKTLIDPLKDSFFQREDEGITMHEIYQRISGLEKAQINPIIEDLNENLSTALDAFADVDEDDRDYLQTFAFICLLSIDVYVKKQLIEHLADEIAEKYGPKDKKK
jgi:DNA-binding transcriptional MerR regulator